MRVAVDALDNPVRVILSTGQVADIALAVALFQDHAAISICADTNYDLDAFVTQIKPRTFSRSSHPAPTESTRATLIGIRIRIAI